MLWVFIRMRGDSNEHPQHSVSLKHMLWVLIKIVSNEAPLPGSRKFSWLNNQSHSFILLSQIKMQRIVGILALISKINFMRSRVE